MIVPVSFGPSVGMDLRTGERDLSSFSRSRRQARRIPLQAGFTFAMTDHNLAAAAGLLGISVLDSHALGESMQRAPMPGEPTHPLAEMENTAPGLGIGYLDEETAVAVDPGAIYIGEDVDVEVFSAMRTSLGRTVVAKMGT